MNLRGTQRVPRALMTAVCAGMLCRIALFCTLAPWNPAIERASVLRGDAGGYHLLACNLLEGHGFSLCLSPPYLPDNNRTPLYPLFLAAVFAVAGTGVWPALLVHIALSMTSLCLMYLLCRRLWDSAHAACAAWLFALCPLDITCTLSLTTETLFVLILLWLLLAWFSYLENPRGALLALAGVLTGVCALCRPVAVYLPAAFLVPLCAVHVTRKTLRTGVVALALFLAGYTLAIAPWLARNHARIGTWKLSCADGANLLFGQAGCALAFETGRDWSLVCTALRGVLAERYAIPAFPPTIAGPYLAGPASNTAWAASFMPDIAAWRHTPPIPVTTVVELATAQIALGSLLIKQHFVVYAKWTCIGMLRTLFTPPWQELMRMVAPDIDALQLIAACRDRDGQALRGFGIWRVTLALFLAAWTAAFAVAAAILFLTGISGIACSGRGAAHVLTWLAVCGYFFALTGPQGHSRYREQCAPLLIPLAAYGLHMILQRIGAFRQSAIKNQHSATR